jgi:hypothetical protein
VFQQARSLHSSKGQNAELGHQRCDPRGYPAIGPRAESLCVP